MELVNNNYHSRQLGLAHPARLQMPIAMVGAGAVGSWTALALARLGCGNLTVMDFDTVEEHNVGPQIYMPQDIGRKKVDALKDRLAFLTPEKITTVDGTYEGGQLNGDILIAALDTMAGRKAMFEEHRGMNKWLIDSRMGGNEIHIYTVKLDNVGDVAAYEETLFSDEDALPIPCTERSVVYNVFVISGMIASYVAKISRNINPPRENIIDLANYMMFAAMDIEEAAA